MILDSKNESWNTPIFLGGPRAATTMARVTWVIAAVGTVMDLLWARMLSNMIGLVRYLSLSGLLGLIRYQLSLVDLVVVRLRRWPFLGFQWGSRFFGSASELQDNWRD